MANLRRLRRGQRRHATSEGRVRVTDCVALSFVSVGGGTDGIVSESMRESYLPLQVCCDNICRLFS